jgi:pimeloyl-ACP methyl ester carboxylesterase
VIVTAASWKDRHPSYTEYCAKYGSYLTRGDRKLFVTDSGKGGPADQKFDATVLFVHGMGGRSEQFFQQMLALAAVTTHKFRVVSLDLLGHGRSHKPTGFESPFPPVPLPWPHLV